MLFFNLIFVKSGPGVCFLWKISIIVHSSTMATTLASITLNSTFSSLNTHIIDTEQRYYTPGLRHCVESAHRTHFTHLHFPFPDFFFFSPEIAQMLSYLCRGQNRDTRVHVVVTGLLVWQKAKVSCGTRTVPVDCSLFIAVF